MTAATISPDADEDLDARRARRRPRSPREVAQAVVLLAPAVWMAAMGWTHRWMTEDGFIYLRIVRQVRVGNGPVYNAGDRVEGATGTLWVGVLSVADLLTPIRLEWLSVSIGIGGTVAAVLLAVSASRRLWGLDDGGSFLVPFGASVFVALLPVWAYATSGLETGLVFAWLGTCVWILAGWATHAPARLSPLRLVVLGLGWLVRPELVLFSAAFLLIVLAATWRTDRWRRRLGTAAAAVALPVGYQLFRMAYYGSVIPNTAIAKEGGSTNWSRGVNSFFDFFDAYWLWVPAIGLLLGGYLPLVLASLRARTSRRTALIGALVAAATANVIYVVSVGGDYHHARMFLPALFALCAPVAVVPVARRHAAGLVVGVWAVAAIVWLRPTQWGDDWFANGIVAPSGFGRVTAEDHGWGRDGPSMAGFDGRGYHHERGLQLRAADPPLADDLPLPFASLYAIGVAGYSLGPDVHVLDLMGLADPLTAHFENQPSLAPGAPRYAGHEKPSPAVWVAARVTPPGSRPDPALFPSFGNPLIEPTTGPAFQEQVAWARAALRCEPIRDLLRASEDPLTLGRLADNLVGSPERTRLRIPPDPEEAYHRFCGPGTPPEVDALRTGG